MNKIAQTALTALIASAVAAPIVYWLLLRAGSRQTVSPHIGDHAHKQGTPTMGGLIILVGIIAGLGIPLGTRALDLAGRGPFVLLIGFGLVGFLDDYVVPRLWPGKRGLGWLPKLAMQIAAAVCAAALDGFTSQTDMALFVLVILFYSNAFNFADGLDGLAGGLAVILGSGFCAITVFTSPPGLLLPMAALVGASLPFLALNAPPAKVFMGDVGALPIGALIGHAAIIPFQGLAEFDLPWANPGIALGIGVMSLLLVAELLPVPIQIGWVKLFKKRAFDFKTPIHHAFQEKGWPEARIVYMFHIVQIGLVIVGLTLATRDWGR